MTQRDESYSQYHELPMPRPELQRWYEGPWPRLSTV